MAPKSRFREKHMRRFLAIAASIFVLSGIPSEVFAAEKSAETPAETGQRRELQGGLEKRLEEIRREIAELDARTKKATGQARANLEQALEDLKARQRDAEARLEEMRKAAGDAWEKARAEMERMLDELDRAFKRIEPERK
jgi:uncharacterized protein with von Willebrand factor type A (vWA) domain